MGGDTTNHVVPSSNDRLHVEITREEGDDSIGNALAVLDEDATEVSNDGRVVTDFETRGDVDLVGTSSDDLGNEEDEDDELVGRKSVKGGGKGEERTRGKKEFRARVMG